MLSVDEGRDFEKTFYGKKAPSAGLSPAGPSPDNLAPDDGGGEFEVGSKVSGRVGRPRVLDETKRREICALVTAGVSLKLAADYVGCSYVTVYRERQRDQDFREQLGRARAVRQLGPLQAMRQASQTHWRAAAWMLERTEPDRFGRRTRNAFGAKELRALKRDLLDIFDEAIDHPQLREEVTQRMQATINYAMRHAWDQRRTGKSLRQAMQLLPEPQPVGDLWDDLERSIEEVAHASGLSLSTDSFERSDVQDLSKLNPTEGRQDQETTEKTASAG